MAIALEPSQFQRTRRLFKPMDHNLAVTSIAKGTSARRIYVDELAEPTAALTWSKHRVFVAGNPNNEPFNLAANRIFVDEIAPEAIAAGRPGFQFHYHPEAWEKQVTQISGARSPVKDQRTYLECRHLALDWKAMVPAGCKLRRVDRALLRQTELKNLDDLVAEICSERDTVEDFLSASFGFCLVKGQEIASWCLSEYNTGGRCEVGIETVEAHRLRGCATVVVSALVEHAFAHGLNRVGWHCWSGNTGSIALAKKVGFKKRSQYPVFVGPFDPRTHSSNGD
jgi:GNAT superfamily N-acetyltransferase